MYKPRPGHPGIDASTPHGKLQNTGAIAKGLLDERYDLAEALKNSRRWGSGPDRIKELQDALEENNNKLKSVNRVRDYWFGKLSS